MKKKIISSIGGVCSLVVSLSACIPTDQGQPIAATPTTKPAPSYLTAPTETAIPEESLLSSEAVTPTESTSADTTMESLAPATSTDAKYIDGVYENYRQLFESG